MKIVIDTIYKRKKKTVFHIIIINAMFDIDDTAVTHGASKSLKSSLVAINVSDTPDEIPLVANAKYSPIICQSMDFSYIGSQLQIIN